MYLKKHLELVLFVTTNIFIITLNSCNNEDSFTIENAKTLNFQSFSLDVPQDWNDFPQQGIDTYVGGLTNKIDTLYFDYGYLSFGSIDAIKETTETLSFEVLIVDDEAAKIVKEKRSGDLKTRYSFYTDKRDGTNLNRIYGYGLQNEALVRAIFLSHQFK